MHFRFAPVSIALSNIAPSRFAPVKSTPVKSEFDKFAPIRSVFFKL